MQVREAWRHMPALILVPLAWDRPWLVQGREKDQEYLWGHINGYQYVVLLVCFLVWKLSESGRKVGLKISSSTFRLKAFKCDRLSTMLQPRPKLRLAQPTQQKFWDYRWALWGLETFLFTLTSQKLSNGSITWAKYDTADILLQANTL